MCEFTVGSRVAYRADGTPGTIIHVYEGALCYDVRFDDGTIECISFENLHKSSKKVKVVAENAESYINIKALEKWLNEMAPTYNIPEFFINDLLLLIKPDCIELKNNNK